MEKYCTNIDDPNFNIRDKDGKETIMHVYINPNEGLGNLFRSIFCNYVYCKNNSDLYNYDLYFKNGPLQLVMNTTCDPSIEEIPVRIISGYQANDNSKVNVSDYDKKKDCIEFIESKFKDTFLYALDRIEEKLGDFDAIHIRCGDQNSTIENPHIRIDETEAIKRLIDIFALLPNNRKYRLYTDSKIVKDYAEGHLLGDDLSIFPYDPIHTAYNNKHTWDLVQCLNTTYEFFSFRKAKKIYSFVGQDESLSTFSMTPAFLYDIPFYLYDGHSIKETNPEHVLRF